MTDIVKISIDEVGIEETKKRLAGRLWKIGTEAEATEENKMLLEALLEDFNTLCGMEG